ncbi:MAG TPA: hypothetical protein PLL64_01565 [Rhodothermales bacterium]|nr:hypothetical protein [Rhodothermales bacterium]HRR08493.1 hypothetical protein [Rhodothermales bacterium]
MTNHNPIFRFFAGFLLAWLLFLHVPVVVHACAMSGKKQVAGKMVCCRMKGKEERSFIGPNTDKKTPTSKSCHRPSVAHRNTPDNSQPTSLKRAMCCKVEVPQTDTDAGIITPTSIHDLVASVTMASLATLDSGLPQPKPFFYLVARPPPNNWQALLCIFRN